MYGYFCHLLHLPFWSLLLAFSLHFYSSSAFLRFLFTQSSHLSCGLPRFLQPYNTNLLVVGGLIIMAHQNLEPQSRNRNGRRTHQKVYSESIHLLLREMVRVALGCLMYAEDYPNRTFVLKMRFMFSQLEVFLTFLTFLDHLLVQGRPVF